MNRKHLTAAAGLLFVGSAAGFLVVSSDTQVEPERAISEAHELAESASARPSSEHVQLAPDAEGEGPLHSYALHLQNDFRPNADGDASGVLVAFDGALTMGEIDKQGDLTWLYVHPAALVFTAQSAEHAGLEPAQQALFERELQQGYFVAKNAQGQIVEYRFSHQPSSVSEGFLRMIAVATQGVASATDRKAASWSVDEVDTAGEARVRYQRDDQDAWLKTKDGHQRLLSDEGLVPAGRERTLRGQGKLVFHRDHLDAATLVEHSTLQLASATMENDAEVRLAIRPGQPSEDVAALRTKLARLPGVSALTLPRVNLRPESERLQEVLGEQSYEDLSAQLAALDATDEGARRSLLARFEADLKLHPEDATRLGERVRGAQERDQTMILSALANADSAEANTALRQISQDTHVEAGARESATAMLGFSRDGDKETVAHLERTSRRDGDTSSHTAMLALGNLADSSRDADPEQSERIVDQLVARLQKAPNADVAMGLLSALGNSGDPRLVELLHPWMLAPNAGLRAGAFFALRLLGTDAAASVMSKAALGDPDPYVRARAMAGLAVKPSQVALATALQAVQADPDARVRLAAVGVLGALPAPEAGAALAQVASQDEDESVRSSAQSLLQRGA